MGATRHVGTGSPASGVEAHAGRRLGRLPATTVVPSAVDHHGEVGHQAPPDPAGQLLQQAGGRGLLEQLGGHVEQLGVPVGHRALDRSDRLDGHAVDLEDLVAEQVDQIVAGQTHPQLVHHDALVALEDVDGDHVPADRADPAGHRPQCTRPVGELHPDQVVEHRSQARPSLCTDCFRTDYDIGWADRGHPPDRSRGPVNRLSPGVA